ncbi:hypothetical protein EMCRGX_G017626 [Ephydatia muelleri]
MNFLLPLPNGAALQATAVVADTTPPTLLSFSLDMNTGYLSLTFDETMNASTIHTTGITFSNRSLSYTLTGGLVVDFYSTVVVMNLDDYDFDVMKYSSLCFSSTSQSYCSLNLSANSVQDMAHNYNLAQTLGAPLYITSDTTNPYLVSYDLDLTAEEIRLTFSEVVLTQATELAPQITLLGSTFVIDVISSSTSINGSNLSETNPNTFSGVIQAYILSGALGSLYGSNFFPSHPPVVVLHMTQKDLNILKSLPTVATSSDNTYLFITISLNCQGLSLQGSSNASLSDIYTLTGGVSSSFNNPVIVVLLSLPDLNELRRRTLISTSLSTTYISASKFTISDMAGNPLVPILSTNGTKAQAFTRDTTPPHLISFLLDMNTGTINITFDKTVNSSSFKASGITFLDYLYTINANLTPSAGVLLTKDGTVLSYMLSTSNLNLLKYLNLCRSQANCYLAYTNTTVLDMSGNAVVPSGLNNATQASIFIRDATPPRITYFAVNMTFGLVTISFSETVNVSTFNPLALTLHDASIISSTVSYPVTGGNRITVDNGLSVQFYFATTDLEYLRLIRPLYDGRSSSYYDASPKTIMDIAGNPLLNVSYIIVDAYFADMLGPSLLGYSFNMSSGLMVLTFSETVSATTFKPSAITLVNNGSTPTVTTQYTLTGGISSLADGTAITLQLTTVDILQILSFFTLATSANNTYLTYTNLLVYDTSANSVVPLLAPIQVTTYFPDLVQPSLVSFLQLDFPGRRLLLQFSEGMIISTANSSYMSLHRFPSIGLGAEYDFDLSQDTFTYNSPVTNQKTQVYVNLSPQTYKTLLLNPRIGSALDSTYLSILPTAISDVRGNPLVEVSSNMSAQVQSIIYDTTSPLLLNFDLDMNTGLLTFVFSDVMNIATFIANQATLQKANTTKVSPVAYFTLTSAEVLSSPDYTVITKLSTSDLNQIKFLSTYGFASSRNNTFITIQALLMKNFGGTRTYLTLGPGVPVLSITDGNGMQVRYFTPDTTPPTLVSFTLDMNALVMSLTFSETVNANSFDLTQLVLMNAALNATAGVALTNRTSPLGPQTTSSQMNSTVITVNLGFADANDIKLFRDLCTNQSDTYLSFTNQTVRDMYGNPVIPVSGQQVSNFTPDSSPVMLLSYSLDMNTGGLVLTFNETVAAATLQITQLSLQNAQTGSVSIFTLTGTSAVASADGYVVVINISTSDLNAIKQKYQLAKNASTTYLTLTSSAVLDMNGNKIVQTNTAIKASGYVADTTPPHPLYFSLDMNSANLYLTFDETVDIASFKYTHFILYSDPDTTAAINYTLTGGIPVSGNSYTPVFSLVSADTVAIKLLSGLAMSVDTTYLSIQNGSLIDTANPANLVVGTLLKASNYTPDSTPPILIQFIANVNLSLLTLVFNEPVNASSLNFTAFTLQSGNSPSASQFTLTGGYTTSSNGNVVTIHILPSDLNKVKEITTLFVSLASSFLSFSTGAVLDMNGNPIVGLNISQAIPSVAYIGDTTDPALLSFDLDMNSQVLTLYFSETMHYSSLNISSISLQSSFNVSSPLQSYRLTGGTAFPSASNDVVVLVNLITSDTDVLKIRKIAISNATTWLTIGTGGILDQAKEPVIPRENGKTAIPVSVYTPDMTPPMLLQFSLDMNTGVISLTFSETVSAQTFNATGFTLQSAQQRMIDSNTFFTLTTTSKDVSTDSKFQLVNLSSTDLNELKKLRSVTNDQTATWMAVQTGAIYDVSGNPVVEVPSNSTIEATRVIIEVTKPTLVSFTLNLTSGTLVLTFSETMDATSLDVTTLKLANNYTVSSKTTTFQLTSDSGILGGDPTGQDSTVITIALGTMDLNAIKTLPTLATSINNTFVSIVASTITNMVGTTVVPRIVMAGVFYPDLVSPMLLSFNLDMNTGVITMTYIETVNTTTVDATALTLLGVPSNTTVYRRKLSGALSTSKGYATTSSITLLVVDLNEIKRLDGLATNISDTYLSLTSNVVLDMNRNPAYPIMDYQAIPVTSFIPDTSSPSLIRFDLNLNTSIMTLYFDETVRVSTFDITQIALHNFGYNPSYTLSYPGIVLSQDGTVVMVVLNNNDLNMIKVLMGLAVNKNSTFLTITPTMIQDMSHNWNNPIQRLQVSSFTSDFVPPQLLSFDLDMNSPALLTLHFSESVNVSLLNVTQISLLSEEVNSSSTFHLTTSSYSSSPNGPTIVIMLSLGDLNQIKVLYPLAINKVQTFLEITQNLVFDMNHNPVLVNFTTGIPVSVYIPDSTPPILQSFGIDMNKGFLVLNFSETVAGGFLNRSAFTIQNSSVLTSSFLILTNFQVNLPYQYSLVLNLTTVELNELKRITTLATSVTDTWLSVTAIGVKDDQGNLLVPIPSSNALQASYFIQDKTKPMLIAFNLDMNAGTLTLIFDETVRASSLSTTQITLQNTQNNSGGLNYTLTGGSFSLLDSTTIVINMSFYDLNQIKKLRGLATNATVGTSDTYLSITSSTIQDMNQNQVTPIQRSNAISVTNITLDTTEPQLVSFNFDYNTEQIVLTFTETVDVSTLMFDQFSIIGYMPNDIYSLTGGSSPSMNDYIVVIQLDVTDVNNLKKNRSIATSNTSTYLDLTPTAILDMYGNTLNFIQPVQVKLYQPDTRSPILVSFTLDMNSNLLLLTFNETVQITSLTVSQITLQQNRSLPLDGSTTYRTLLAGNILTNSDNPTVMIQLQPIDTNYIKTYPNMATSKNNTYISLTNLTIQDMNGNYIVPIYPFSAKQVATFTPDTTSPILNSFLLNLTSEQLVLTFDETVNINTLDSTQLTLLGMNGSFYMLTGGLLVNSFNSTHVALSLTTVDLNLIKEDENLAISMSSSFIAITQYFISDMAGNLVVPINGSGMQTSVFFPDNVKPKLVAFSLDMNTGVLLLTFSETVRVSTLNPTSLTLQSMGVSANISYQLMSGFTTSPNNPIVSLQIPVTDLNNIKRILGLATNINSTFISLISSTIKDMNANAIVPLSTIAALQCSTYVKDTTRPSLVAYTLDMNANILWMTFSETMNVSSLNVAQITLVSSPILQPSSTTYTLTNSSIVLSSPNDPVVPIQLSLFDSNELKKLTALATNLNNTFLLLTNLTLTDMSSNKVLAVYQPFAALAFSPDVTPPYLVQFLVDMNVGVLLLSFSETVNVSSIALSEITLQNAITASVPNLRLSLSSIHTAVNDPIVAITMSTLDYNMLTAITHLYTSINDSYLTATSLTVMDMNGNRLTAIANGNAQQAAAYIYDITSPILLSFTVNLDNWTLNLSFDRTVAAQTLDYTKFHAYSDVFGTLNLTLTNGSFNLPYTNMVILSMVQLDVDRIKLVDILWRSVNNTWLHLDKGAVYDWTLRNPVNVTTIRALSSPIENVPPHLLSFTVNVTSGILVLNFDEPVRTQDLISARITLQNGTYNSTQMYTLTMGSVTPSPNGRVVQINISFDDLNAIKALKQLYVSLQTAFINLDAGAIKDMAGNPSASITGLQASFYVNDTTHPYLVSYTIDMNSGIMVFTFSETVSVSSFNITTFTLQVSSNISYQYTNQFQTFTSMTQAVTSDLIKMLDSRIVNITISLNDLNELKRKRVATGLSTTWLVFPSSALVSNSFQSVLPLLNGGTLTLSFSETVDATTLSVAEFTLTNMASNGTQSYTLTNSSLYQPSQLLGVAVNFTKVSNGTNSTLINITSTVLLPPSLQPLSTFNSPQITIYFSSYDLNVIKTLTHLATDLNTTFLSLTSSAVTDMYKNNVTSISPGYALEASSYQADVTSPVLLQFDLDMNSGNLTMTFSETINVTSLNVSQITLQNGLDPTAPWFKSYVLKSYPPFPNTTASFSTDWTTIVVQIGIDDLDAVKNLLALAVNTSTTYMSYTSTTISDNSKNRIIPRPLSQPLQVNTFTPDTTRPQLVSFDLDMNKGLLILTFSETVKVADSLSVVEMTLQSEKQALNNSLFVYTLTNVSSPVDLDSRVVIVVLGFADLNQIKYRSPQFTTSVNNTFISITDLTVVDQRGNDVIEIPENAGLRVRIYTPDTTRPVLINSTLDMNSATLILTFSETVNAYSLNVAQIWIQNDTSSSHDYLASPRELTSIY